MKLFLCQGDELRYNFERYPEKYNFKMIDIKMNSL